MSLCAIPSLEPYNSTVDDQVDAINKARRFADLAYTTAVDAIAKDTQEKLIEARYRLNAQGQLQSGVMSQASARIYGASVKALVQSRLDGLLEGFELHHVTLIDVLVNSTVEELMSLKDAKVHDASKAAAASGLDIGPITRDYHHQLIHSECGISRASVKLQIERRRLMLENKEQSAASVTNIYHVHGHNPRWSQNSTDHSVNVVITSHEQVFTDLRKQIESGIPVGEEQKDILERLTALEQAKESRSFAQQYSEFIGAAANHMTLIAPFIPALAEMLQKTL
jgi:hypothetical protein